MSRAAFQFRWVMALLLPLALAACGGPARTLALSTVTSDEIEGKVTIYVATTRGTAAEPQYFTGERGARASFAKLEITVPRGHKSGELELPDTHSSANPAKHFAASSVQLMSLPVILTDVRKDLARRPASERDVLVFIHGYNTNFADAAYRFAQIVYDSGFKGVPVLFTWPSRAELLAYPYDRESAFFSRDVLENGLRSIAKDIGAARMDILAHSMGTLLTLETLRQASIRGDGNFGGKLRNVMLAAPDVDLDVFKTQMSQIKRPITVFISADDRALDFSRRFAGNKVRLGALSAKDTQEIAELEKMGIDVIDLSAVSTSDSLNHGKFAASPKVVGLIGKRLQADRGIAMQGPGFGDRIGDIAGGVVGTVGGTLELVVSAPSAIAGQR